MEYRTKAAIILALIFFFMFAAVTAIYLGVRVSNADRAGTYDGGIMVESVIKTEKSAL